MNEKNMTTAELREQLQAWSVEHFRALDTLVRTQKALDAIIAALLEPPDIDEERRGRIEDSIDAYLERRAGECAPDSEENDK